MSTSREAVVVVLLSVLGCSRGEPSTFTVADWRAAPQLGRYSMAQDYLDTREVTSMSLAEIVADLGQPDETINTWSYALSANGLPEPGPHGMPYFVAHPTLDANFSWEHRLLGLGVTWSYQPPEGTAFDAAAWRELDPDGRATMALDLLKGDRFVGCTKDELERELGVPDDKTSGICVKYTVDYHVIDDQILAFSADGSGKVISAELYDG
jgi:hypothetical protein